MTPGTIIEMDGYALNTGVNHKGEPVDYLGSTSVVGRLVSFDDVRKPLRCKVRKVQVCVTEASTYFIVETDIEYTEEEQKILHRKYHAFGMGHINRIIHQELRPIEFFTQSYFFCDTTAFLQSKLQAMDNHHCFNIKKVVEKGHKDGVFMKVKTNSWPYVDIKFNKKRVKSWLKQNINRLKNKKYLLV